MKTRIIIFTLIPILLALGLTEGLVLVSRLAILLALVLLFSFLWVLFGIRGIGVQVEKIADQCQVGEELDRKVTIFNRSKLPKLLLKVAESTDIPGNQNLTALNLSPGGSYKWQSSLHCRHRGQYHLGAFTAMVTDPFGLFSRQRSLGESQNILVYPATIELPFFESSPLNVFGYNTGYRSFSQISQNASSVREYINGDSLNHIHWRSTAHTGQLMVKMFDSDRSHTGSQSVWIVIDMLEAARLGEDGETTEEYSVTIAASLLKKYIESGMQVGLVASGDQPCLFPLERGEQHFWQVMGAMALMKATGQVPIERLITDKIEHFKGNSISIIITPSDSNRLLPAIYRLQKQGNTVLAVLLEPASFGGTSSSSNLAHNINSSGAQAYVVRKGDDLATVLDNRISSRLMRFI